MVTSDRHVIKLAAVTCVFGIVLFFSKTFDSSETVFVGKEPAPGRRKETFDQLRLSENSPGYDRRVSDEHQARGDTQRYTFRKLKWFDSSGYRSSLTRQGRQPGRNVTGSGGIPGNSSLADDDSDVECGDVHNMAAAERCDFVKRTDDCAVDEGFIDYTFFVYCDFSSNLLPLALIILVIWWLFLFIGLAVTADDFFCPSLAVISDTMKLSHNVAGVTFLAFGNGAPDIFSAIAAIGNAKNGDAGLAVGALFGAGVFVTTVVAGTIAIIHPFDAMQRPFLRDMIFYLAATFWTFYILWKKEITKYEAIGFILLYVVYVVVVVVGRYIYTRTRNRLVDDVDPRSHSPNIQDADVEENGGVISNAHFKPGETEGERRPLLNDANISYTSVDSDTDYGGSLFREFLAKINPIDTEHWNEMRLYRKIYEIFKCPLMFLLIITVPVVNYEENKHNWNRYLYTIQCITGPMFSVVATKVGFNMVNGNFPAWAITLILAVALATLVFFTSKDEEEPGYHAAFSYLGFVVAVVWIYSIANEIVNILQTFGIVLHISNAVLGLTLLAWGNSIGDFIADTVMARQGFPRMGISACFGGPLFNLLLGIGIPFTIATVKNGSSYQLKLTLEEIVLAAFLVISLISSLLIVPLSKFKMSRGWGIYLLILYVIFLVIALLTEAGVITANIPGVDG